MQDNVNGATSPPNAGQRDIAAAVSNGHAAAVSLDPFASVADVNHSNEESGDIVTVVFRFLGIFLKRKWTILGIAIVFFAFGALSAFIKTPLYTASVRIQIDQDAVKVLDNGVTSPQNERGSDYQRTQFELLRSRAMAERVVSSLQLQNDEDFFKPRNVTLTSWLRGWLSLGRLRSLFAPTPSVGQALQKTSESARRSWAVGILSGNVGVWPVSGSRLVDIGYTDPSPARAQRIANAYADAYVASTLDKRFEANSYAKVFLEDRVKQIKLRLEDSEKALLDFAEREKIVQVTDRETIAESNFAAANAALGQLISERIKNEEDWRQVEKATAINVPQLLSNSVIDGLRAHRNELKRDYEEKRETFKPSYPAMIEITNKMKEIERQLASELDTIKASTKAAYESSLHQENQMKDRIEELRTDVLELRKKSIQYNFLKREAETNRGLYNNLLQRFKEVDVASGVGTNNIFIVDRALMPGAPSEPNINRIIKTALIFGLCVGLALAYIIDLFDDRVRSPEDLEKVSGLATLGLVPVLSGDQTVSDELKNPRSATSEAYRSLAMALQFSTAKGLPRSILVTSAGPNEGKSSTALAIARHFASTGLRVLLVDADLRRPILHVRLGQENTTGLSNYLTGAATPPDLVRKTDHANLAFMSSGPLPPNAGDLLGGTRVFSLLSVGAEVFDLIVIDSSPVLGLADAQLLAGAAAATVFVVGAGQSRNGMVQAALRRLQLARVTPIGTVLTKFDTKAVSYRYGYRHQYGYGYGYGVTHAAAAGAGGMTTSGKNAADGVKPALAK